MNKIATTLDYERSMDEKVITIIMTRNVVGGLIIEDIILGGIPVRTYYVY
jgi:hypothetical protein